MISLWNHKHENILQYFGSKFFYKNMRLASLFCQFAVMSFLFLVRFGFPFHPALEFCVMLGSICEAMVKSIELISLKGRLCVSNEQGRS